MSPFEHYNKAEGLLEVTDTLKGVEGGLLMQPILLAAAQVHATLALVPPRIAMQAHEMKETP